MAIVKKRFPSRDRVKYLGVPVAFHEALERYADAHSTEFDRKSVSWAARVLFGPILRELDLLDVPIEQEE